MASLTPAEKADVNNRSAFKDIPEKKEKDMRPPQDRGNNLYRDNPPEPSDPKSLVR